LARLASTVSGKTGFGPPAPGRLTAVIQRGTAKAQRAQSLRQTAVFLALAAARQVTAVLGDDGSDQLGWGGHRYRAG
jgi:hypothetical protein